MVYDPATDFLALWRNIAGVVSKVEMPTLDLTVAALARAGLITLSVSATAPTVSQPTTAWLQTAVPSNSAEGTLFLWNGVTDTYQPATAALFLDLLQASAGQSGVSWWTSTGGAPLNTVGNNGDFAVRLDNPFGVYGPKANGAWPANPVPGTADVITSTALDNTFGTTEGALIYRGPAEWQALEVGAANTVLSPVGGAPTWENLSSLLDAFFTNAQGSILYRDAGLWEALAPGTTGNILVTNGPGANPNWGPRTAEFSSGDTIVFQQSTAPVGWTKQTALNDYGLRVTAGAVGTVAGTAFSAVFAQTAVGNTTISQAMSPSHVHPHTGAAFGVGSTTAGVGTGAAIAATGTAGLSMGSIGGDGPHAHSISLSLSYVDVIIASKD